jgi:glutamyl-Q tRNA(Asp) synthetase
VSGVDGLVYPGTCRGGIAPGRTPRAWRVKVDGQKIEFIDAIQGSMARDLAADFGDFVVRRADGFYAYQLAVVVDDAAQGITEVVRGADLIESTPRQIHLQRLLDLPTPDYLHLPVALNAQSGKLSKQTFAAPLDAAHPLPALLQVMRFLDQAVPPELTAGSLADFWRWAVMHWEAKHVPRVPGIVVKATGDSSA